MKPCDECAAARETQGLWQRYDPACLWCGARLVQAIGRCGVSSDRVKQRRLRVIADWAAHGHDRESLRTHARSSAMPLQPRAGRST